MVSSRCFCRASCRLWGKPRVASAARRASIAARRFRRSSSIGGVERPDAASGEIAVAGAADFVSGLFDDEFPMAIEKAGQ